MMAALLWTFLAIVVVGALADGIRHVRMAASEKRACDRQADRLRREVESVPVHADGMTQNGVRNHVG